MITQSAAVKRIRWTQPVAPSRLDSGWDSWTERPLWTAGCFCEGGRPAGRGALWAAGLGGCTDTVYQHPAEEKTVRKMYTNRFKIVFVQRKEKKDTTKTTR